MAINIKNLEARIQKKAASVTSNTPTAELGDIIEAANLATGGLAQYDSAGLLPTASSTQNIKIAYLKKDNSIRFNSGSAWNKMAPNAAVGGAVSEVTPYSGYVFGGYNPGSTNTNDIEKFNLTSETNGVSTGNLLSAARLIGSGRSSTHGYSAGGLNPPSSPARFNTISKFPFAADADATDVGDLLHRGTPAHSNPSSSSTHSYSYGGYNEPAATRTNTIQKWAHSTDGNATDVADLLKYIDYGESVHSADNGYTLGGLEYPSGTPPTTTNNQISKFPFASDANATDVGDLTTTSHQMNAFQSSTTGYKYGGGSGVPTGGDTIESFPFASDTNSADTNDNATSAVQFEGTGHNTDDAGFIAGGRDPSSPTPYNQTEIDKYLFAGGADMTNVADLAAGRSYHGGVNQN